MDFKNLRKNILYEVCDENARKNWRGPLDVESIYRRFSDIPDKEIAAGIRSLVTKGWLKEDSNRSLLYLTERGLSELRSSIPPRVLPACSVPAIWRNRT
jgi:hypothetical protein